MVTASNAYLFEEHRGSQRDASNLKAQGLVRNFDGGFNCRLIDISDTGALIAVENVDILPKRMKLFIPDTKMLHECEVVRYGGGELGLRFTSSVNLQP